MATKYESNKRDNKGVTFKETQRNQNEIKELYFHLDILKRVIIEDIHGFKSRRKENEENGALITFLRANKIASIKLISFKDKAHPINSPSFIKDFILFCESKCSSIAYKMPSKKGQPKGNLLKMIESGFYIFADLKKLGVTNDELAQYLNSDTDTFTRILRKVQNQVKSYFALTKEQAKEISLYYKSDKSNPDGG